MISLPCPHLRVLCAPTPASPATFGGNSCKSLSLSLRNEDFLNPSLFKPKFGSISSSIKRSCIKEKFTPKSSEEFSVLESDIPWDSGTVWSTLALYLFSLHVPLSFGGLSVVAHLLPRSILDAQTEVLSSLAIQTLELSAVLWLLRCMVKPRYKLFSLFQAKKQSEERNLLLTSVLGFGFLIFLVLFTSLVADELIGPKDVNNPILKEILSSGYISVTACMLLYCVVTPLLEEIVYRGFLLTSLASEMKWHQAVVISSAVFSAAHFSCENFLQLFIVGWVLGCSYCWTGNLRSSFFVHSLYNALILVITLLS